MVKTQETRSTDMRPTGLGGQAVIRRDRSLPERSRCGRRRFVPIDGQWLRVWRLDQAEAQVADRVDGFAGDAGDFTVEFGLGHSSGSFPKRVTGKNDQAGRDEHDAEPAETHKRESAAESRLPETRVRRLQPVGFKPRALGRQRLAPAIEWPQHGPSDRRQIGEPAPLLIRARRGCAANRQWAERRQSIASS